MAQNVDELRNRRHAEKQQKRRIKRRFFAAFEDAQRRKSFQKHDGVIQEAVAEQQDLRAHHVLRKQQGKDRADDRKRAEKDQNGVLRLPLEKRYERRAVHRHTAELPREEPHRADAGVDVFRGEPLLPYLGKQHADAEDEQQPQQLFRRRFPDRKRERDGQQQNAAENQKMYRAVRLRGCGKGPIHRTSPFVRSIHYTIFTGKRKPKDRRAFLLYYDSLSDFGEMC